MAEVLARGGEAGVPVSVVNYSRYPVHATAVALDEKMLAERLGVPPGTPVAFRSAAGGAEIPSARGVEGDTPVVFLYAALAPTSRLELVAEAAARAPAAPAAASCDATGDRGELRNGVLRFAREPKGWSLAFDGPGTNRPVLIRDGLLDFWLDDRNRGRIANGNPKEMGLLQFSARARREKGEASVAADGRPIIQRVSRFDGFAKDCTVTETFELAPGMPLLICRVRWRNEGGAPLWVAYVGSGDGIRGKWGKDLMPTPLIERKKSPLQGDLNGSETRCAWVGGLCRISMESPATGCGVGLSTLLPTPGKVGQGSMIWGCGAYGFQCNFIDPVQGQFPFLVPPGGELTNGFVFLAAQAGESVFRRTVDLWKALQGGRQPRLPPPCAVLVGGQPVHAQTLGALGPVRDPRLSLRLDFSRRFVCRADGPATLRARPLAPGGKTVTLLETAQGGTHAVDLNAALGWRDETAFVLENPGGVAVSIAEELPEAPRMLSPVADAAFTDWAAMFRWRAIPGILDYELQLARTADFAGATVVRVTSSQDYPWYLVPDDRLPAPGRWHWRIRGLKGDAAGAWSETRAFAVNDDHATKPLKRPLTAAAPLFTLEASQVTDFTGFHPDVPADLAPYVGIVAEGFEAKGIPVTEFARGMSDLPYAFMLRSHWVGLADLEWLFQHVPNFVGIQGGEHLSSLYRDSPDGDMRYHHRLTRLCAKHGMFYQEADGTYRDDKWRELMDKQGAFVREYGPWLVLSQKNNIIRRQFYSQSAAMGLWLGGVTHQHGAWEDGGFYWQNAGFNGLGVCAGERSGVLRTMPRIFWDLVFVMGIGRGCGIYSLDGQTLMYSPKEAERFGAWPSAIWDSTGKTSDTFGRFVAPLIRGTVRHGLIPTKEEVLRNIRLAVYQDGKVAGDEKAWPHYAEYGPLYAGTYGFRAMGGIHGQLWEFFPNTGRYYFIPVLPQGNEPLGPGIRNLPVSELQDVARVREIFDAAYPAGYDGEAFVCRVGDTLTALNTRENEDVTESFSLPLAAGPVTRLSGRLAPHSYLVGKVEDGGRRLWLQANTEYPDRDLEMAVACSRPPQRAIEPPSAAKDVSWDDAARVLHLRLSLRDGAVEIKMW